MKIGYARVSTPEQSFTMQEDALRQAGCTAVYQEVSSGARAARPVLDAVLRQLRGGDVLVVWKFDRLGRSLTHLVELVNELRSKDVGLQSLHDPIDTTTSHGRLSFHLFAALAEFERDLIRERTCAGLSAARARGRTGGRPKGLSRQGEATACAVETLYRARQLSVQQIANQLGISKRTLYAYLRHRGVPIGAWHPMPRAPHPAARRDRTRSTQE
jgi:DNA invertase Pin-like site-specific DNA recombinase